MNTSGSHRRSKTPRTKWDRSWIKGFLSLLLVDAVVLVAVWLILHFLHLLH